MIAYLARRLLTGLLIIWGVYTLTFLAVNLAPGDPFTARESAKIQEEDLQRLRALWGYDRPVVERYLLHLRKMFWRDAEWLEAQGGGLAFEVRGEGGRNVLRARVQPPPAVLLLQATQQSRQESGAGDVRLVRGADGGYAPQPIGRGRYLVGSRFLQVGEAPVVMDAEGLRLEAAGGLLRARPARDAAPPSLVLAGAGGARVEVPAGEGGRYGPVALAADAWSWQDPAAAQPVTFSVPESPLEAGGPGFNLGVSIQHKKPVFEHLRQPLLNTLLLAAAALVVQFAAGVALGVFSAVRRGGWLDRSLTLGSLFVYSMPVFWLAVMLQLLFAVRLGWLPVAGMHDEGQGGLLDLLEHMVMPVFVLGLGGAAATARYQRSAMLEVMSQDYVRTARAKGLSEHSVVWRHALRNALMPTITLLGLSLPFLVSGSVITEQIFSWPGMGREAILAIANRDVFIVTGVTLVATVMVVAGSILADLLYALVDPRVRIE
ncbi:MAG: ABC transporter permease [Planctomycetia bacterium]